MHIMVVSLLFDTDQTVIVGVVEVVVRVRLAEAPHCACSDRLTAGCCTCRQTNEATLKLS